jgi:hypothetical protein
MPPQVLRNLHGRRFADVSISAGDYFTHRWLGRAVAIGDLDNDGDADVVVSHLGAAPELLRNDSHRAQSSLRLTLVGTRSARQPLGATVRILAGDVELTCQTPAGGSFQASHDPRVLVALPQEMQTFSVQVSWPGTGVETWTELPRPANGEALLVQPAEGVPVSGLQARTQRLR